MALNELMWNNMHSPAVSTVIEPTCSNPVHSNQASIYLFSWVLGANFTEKAKAFFHLLKSDANSKPVTNLGGRFCEKI